MPSGCRIPRTDSSVSLVFHAGGLYHPGHTVTMFGTNTTNWRMLLLEDSAGFYLMNNTSHTSLCSFNRCGLWVPHHPQHQQLQVYKVKLKALSSVKCLSPKSLKVWWCSSWGKSAQLLKEEILEKDESTHHLALDAKLQHTHGMAQERPAPHGG